MSFMDKIQDGVNAIQEEGKKQLEKAKEAIENFKPHQLEKKIIDAEQDVEKFEQQLVDLTLKERELEYKISNAKFEKKMAEERLHHFRKNQ